jgi:hypothetical protein
MYVWNDSDGFMARSTHAMRGALLDDLSSPAKCAGITMSTILRGVFVNHIRLGSLCLHGDRTTMVFPPLRSYFMETSTWWNPRHDRTKFDGLNGFSS